jgi:nucleoside-diphosphate-sugar epimerase
MAVWAPDPTLRTVLVTGASGRVGRAIAIRLMHRHTVRGLDRAPSSTVQHLGDVDDPALLAVALRGVDAVVHTAS